MPRTTLTHTDNATNDNTTTANVSNEITTTGDVSFLGRQVSDQSLVTCFRSETGKNMFQIRVWGENRFQIRV